MPAVRGWLDGAAAVGAAATPWGGRRLAAAAAGGALATGGSTGPPRHRPSAGTAAAVTVPSPLAAAVASYSPAVAGAPYPAAPGSSGRAFRLAPSDFAFLWDSCARCFYLKAHGMLYRPRAPFPSVFGTIDLEMKRYFRGRLTGEVLPAMPPGEFLCEDEDAWVESVPLSVPGHSSTVYIRGKLDCLVRDENDEYGVIDFKTSSVSKSLATYSRQLHAYAFALECPSDASELLPGRVSHMGLVVYEPTSFACDNEGVAAVAAAATKAGGVNGATNGGAGDGAAPLLPAYALPGDTVAADLRGRAVWVPIPRDDTAFGAFLGEVLSVLEAPEPPAPVASSWGGKTRLACGYCQYLEDVRAGGLAHSGKLPD
ncbi:hypothetical protein MMPV_007455 [Pyropia vietnamensis]